MDYKGYAIEVSIFHDVADRTFHTAYTIRDGRVPTLAGTVAGGIKTIDDAERAAEKAARRWVDGQG